jgi:23S rRNA (cytidine1920-2'-O)/16S rRNA (cytidine1409-2'-O)-methyltransferase
MRVDKGQIAPASRGGAKLEAALDRFEIDPSGRNCLDAGAAAGGFTEVLLARGAAHVIAVDVGRGQLVWRLRTDPRVTLLERTNVRRLEVSSLPYRPDLITADLSFISLSKVLPGLAALAVPSDGRSDFVLLVKPQFEADRRQVEHGGVVTDPDVWREVLERVAAACRDADIAPRAVMVSPLRGPAGNAEFFLHGVLGGPEAPLDVRNVIGEASA